MNEITLRPARPDELEDLGALKLRASLAYGDHKAELLQLPDARKLRRELVPATVVAEVGGAAIGFVTLVHAEEADEIEELFVEPAAWRKGVGRKLMEDALQRSAKGSSTTVRVVANGHAQAFYSALGFSVVGEVMTQFELAPLMERRVS